MRRSTGPKWIPPALRSYRSRRCSGPLPGSGKDRVRSERIQFEKRHRGLRRRRREVMKAHGPAETPEGKIPQGSGRRTCAGSQRDQRLCAADVSQNQVTRQKDRSIFFIALSVLTLQAKYCSTAPAEDFDRRPSYLELNANSRSILSRSRSPQADGEPVTFFRSTSSKLITCTMNGMAANADEFQSVSITAAVRYRDRSWIRSGRVPSLDGLRAIAIGMVTNPRLPQWVSRSVGTWAFRGYAVFRDQRFLDHAAADQGKGREGIDFDQTLLPTAGLPNRPRIPNVPPRDCVASVSGLGIRVQKQLDRALTYTSCFSPLTMAPVIGHTWSLSVEEHFYLLWPLIFLLSVRIQLVLLSSYILLSPALRLLIMRSNIGWLDGTYSSPAQMASIAVGCVLAYVVSKGRFQKPALWAPLGLGLFFLSLLACLKSPAWTGVWRYAQGCGAGCLIGTVLTT